MRRGTLLHFHELYYVIKHKKVTICKPEQELQALYDIITQTNNRAQLLPHGLSLRLIPLKSTFGQSALILVI